MQEWTSSLPPVKYEVSLADTYLKIITKILTDIPALLTWAPKYPSPFTSLPTLIYSTGPWTNDNVVTAVEFFFQRNAYHPFAQYSHPQKHSDPVPLPRFYRTGLEQLSPTAECSTTAHTKRVLAWTQTIFVNRNEVNNVGFLDKSKIFSYRTIGLGETIRNPIQTFLELSRYVGRMANRKASGDDKMPADLFKKAPEAFRKRAWILTLINIILAGHYVCSEELLEARVVLLCKDHGNPTLLAN